MGEEAVPRRVLAVYAHPDDPEVACGGTLARWSGEGAEVHVVVCTRGEKGTVDPDADPEDLSRQRAAEAEAAAATLGVTSVENLGHPDGELRNDLALRESLVARIRSLQPDVVVGPDPTAVFFGATYVNHVDHREVGFAVLDACTPAASSPWYFPDAGGAHQVGRIYLSATLEPDTWVDIADVLATKVAALACHRSQIGDEALVDEVVRRRASSAGAPAGLAAAESFRVVHLRG